MDLTKEHVFTDIYECSASVFTSDNKFLCLLGGFLAIGKLLLLSVDTNMLLQKKKKIC